jgi:site-specific DNA-cytosine methylase
VIRINVLSLFDGMSCGQIALERIGLKTSRYFASEIEPNAIKVTQKKYSNTVQLGDVTNWREWDLPNIDFLMGGSPCQGFSTVGKGLNFDDPRSKLFFKYVDILNHYKPKYFLLENVKMKKEYQDIISFYLGVEPVKINSSLVSAQNRERLYWTNIPNVTQPKDKNINLTNILIESVPNKFYIKNRKGSISYPLKKYDEFLTKHGYIPKMFNPYNCKEINKKSPTLTAVGSRIGNSSTVLIKEDSGDIRQLVPLEWERLQTVPENYTDCISDTNRYNVLGNGWTVDVIVHILEHLK